MHLLRILFLLAALLTTFAARAADPLANRWLYLQQNLQVTENLPKIESLLERAAKSGYNGVVLADYKLNILDRVPDHYFRNAERFRLKCAELKLEIIPAVMSFGYSDGILAHDPNLAKALPCRKVPFQVEGGHVTPAGQTSNLVPGDFEESEGDKFSGWDFQDEPGVATFRDEAIKHEGKSSLRIENPAGASGNRRVSKLLKVRPWMQLHASVWLRAAAFESASDMRMFAMGKDGRVLSHSNLGVTRDQDWGPSTMSCLTAWGTKRCVLYAGVWGARGGKLWLDDLRVTEEPFVNLVRRPGCPLAITNKSGDVTYEEGKDFAELRDEKLGVTPWAGNFDVYHAPPQLKLLPGSRITDGTDLLANYFHAVTIYDNQVPCSLTEPRVFEIVEDQVKRVEKLFRPKTYFLSHDEIRVANWSQPEREAHQTAGQVLAANMRHCVDIVRKVNPKARLCVWSDMFDPHHNAVDNFYLVNGDLASSWEGLPKDMLIVNWNSGKPDKSLPYFAGRGHSQVLAGYYDAPPEGIVRWLEAGKDVKGINGAMYTTWQGKFDDLEKFAELAWGGQR